MSRSSRSLLTAIAIITSASFLIAYSRGVIDSGRQAQASGSVSAAQAAPFVGNWLVTVAAGGRESAFAVAIKTDSGNTSATVSSDTQPTIDVQNISLSGQSLVLTYVTTFQGRPIPTVLTLTPAGEGLSANTSVMDGQY